MKLKYIIEQIKTWDKIQLSDYNGETFYPTYADVDRYKDRFVTEITAVDKGIIRIHIRETE